MHANRLTGIIQGSQSVGVNYDNANRRTCLTLPNGVIGSYGYDNDSRVTALTYGMGGSCSSPPSNLGNLNYSYDTDGRVTGKTGSFATTGMPSTVNGNIFNANNAMTGFNGTTLSYDANGNLTGDGTNAYTWDARNHLTAMSGGVTASFVYDGFARRMSKSISAITTQFLYDGLNPVQELNSSNQATANLMTGLRIDERFTRTDSSNNVSTLLTDALGSTIGLVGSGQSIATSYTYEPFGATSVGGAANGSNYEFTGRENDGTGLYFNRARYYSPTFQRFITQDPIGFDGGDVNLYAYGLNRPTGIIDPSGRDTLQVGGSVTVAGGDGAIGGGLSASGGCCVRYTRRLGHIHNRRRRRWRGGWRSHRGFGHSGVQWCDHRQHHGRVLGGFRTDRSGIG